MDRRIPTRLTAAEGRRFGVTVGLAFAGIGALMLWRHHPERAMVAFGLGGVLVLAGLVIPTRLGPVERAWMRLAHLISKVTTPIFMGVVYFLVITPIGWLRSRGGKSPLKHPRGQSRWEPHAPVAPDSKAMERQF